MKFIVFVCFLFISQPSHASDTPGAYAWVEKMVGKEWTERIFSFFGKKDPNKTLKQPPPQNVSPEFNDDGTIKMPPIPSREGVLSPEEQTLKRSLDQQDVKDAILKSQLDDQFVRELLLAVMKRKIADVELKNAANTFAQGSSREGHYRSLVLSQEYYQMENEQHPVTKDGAKLAASFAREFYRDNVNFDSYLEVNLYRLKRRMAERALEVVDTLPVSGNQLYYWYALYSSAIASKLREKSSKTGLRYQSDDRAHFEWAKSVPLQHLKGELVIKIHLLMNLWGK